MVHDGWDAVVGGHRQELRLELLALADVHRQHPVRQAALLHEDAHLLPVGGAPPIEVDHATHLRDSVSPPYIPRACEDQPEFAVSTLHRAVIFVVLKGGPLCCMC